MEENKGSSEKEKAQRGLSGEMRLVTLQLPNGETRNFYAGRGQNTQDIVKDTDDWEEQRTEDIAKEVGQEKKQRTEDEMQDSGCDDEGDKVKFHLSD
ncbi:hypothetical protein ACROYT_G014417 [Oculina patagonica]